MDGSLSGLNISYEQSFPTPYANSPLLLFLLMSLTNQKHSPNVKSTFKEEYDFVIVGAGSAGSTIAARLSEVYCVSVLLLEAGKPPPILSDIPAISRSFASTDIDWKYTTTPQKYAAAGHVNRTVPWPSGKTLGGSSTLNTMVYVRGNRRNYDEWASRGAKGWSYEEVLPYFKKLEDNVDFEFLSNGFHARGGPITASKPKYNPLKKVITTEAVLNEGYNFVDPNAAEQIGFYDLQGSIRRGQRCSTAKAYLVPNENRKNLDILPNAMVKKILIENKIAVGVEFDLNGVGKTVRAKKEVILSAGTVNSAQLLMLSGIGPMTELKKFNIPLVADLPVGLNLQDHPRTYLLYQVDNSLPKFEDEIKDEDNIKNYIANRFGPLTSAAGMLLSSFLTNYNAQNNLPDHSVYFLDFSRSYASGINFKPEIIENFFRPLKNESLIWCGSQLLRTRSLGTVSLQSSNPYDHPLIDPNFLADFQDVEDIVQGLKVCQEIVRNPAMRKINARPVNILMPGCEEFGADEDLYLRCIARTITTTTNHQVGTAKMGDPADPTTVVDPQLRVKGIKGLRVVDASIMPTIPWSNTNIPTIMVAEKASDIIKSTLHCTPYSFQYY